MDGRRLIPIGAAVTALLVLAGAASHGRPLRSGSGTGPSAAFFDYVGTTTILFALAMAVVVVLVLRADKSWTRPQRGPRWNLFSALFMFLAAVLLAYLISTNRFQQRLRALEQHMHTTPTRRSTTREQPKPPADARNARIRWDEVAVVLVLLGGLCAYLVVSRSKPHTLGPLVRGRRQLAQALDESLDDLRRDPDVRRAIIAAYARMERALAAAGVPRVPSEAPHEYLERSLVELETSAGAARNLTELFERAKFSQHEPAESMRDEAIDALVAVRDELRRTEAAPVAA